MGLIVCRTDNQTPQSSPSCKDVLTKLPELFTLLTIPMFSVSYSPYTVPLALFVPSSLKLYICKKEIHEFKFEVSCRIF